MKKQEEKFTREEINVLLNKNGLNITVDELLNIDKDIIWWKNLNYTWKLVMLYNHNYEYRYFNRGRIKDYNIILERIEKYEKSELKDFIEELKSMTIIYFNFDQNILIKDFKPLGKLEKIEKLFLNGLRFCSLSSMPILKRLKFLDAKGSDLDSISTISKFSEIKHLNISQTNIVNLKGIEECTNLHFLNVSNTNITSIDEIKNLQLLNYLSIFQTRIKSLEPLKNLTNLETLFAFSTDIQNLESIADIKSLEKINISNTQIKNLLPLKNNMNLKEISAKGTRVTLDNVEKLKEFLLQTTVLLN